MPSPTFKMINHGYNSKDQHVALYYELTERCYWLSVNGRLLIGDKDRDKMDKLFQGATNAR